MPCCNFISGTKLCSTVHQYPPSVIKMHHTPMPGLFSSGSILPLEVVYCSVLCPLHCKVRLNSLKSLSGLQKQNYNLMYQMMCPWKRTKSRVFLCCMKLFLTSGVLESQKAKLLLYCAGITFLHVVSISALLALSIPLFQAAGGQCSVLIICGRCVGCLREWDSGWSQCIPLQGRQS